MKENQILTIYYPVELIKRIDNYRYDQHIPTRSEAVRYLLNYALEIKPKFEEKK